MNRLTDRNDQMRVLLVEPEEEMSREIRSVLSGMDLTVDHVRSHLKAAAQFEDQRYDCILAATRGQDISGLELCTLVRAREGRRVHDPVYLALFGPEADLMSIFASNVDVDDYLAIPCTDRELEWKIKRAERAVAQSRECWRRIVDDESGLLTPDGLRSYLAEEVNRVGRRQGWISLCLLSVPGLGILRASYGEKWLDWFKTGIWASLRRQLRNYDRLATMDNDFLCLVAPDLQEEGTRQLLGRLAKTIGEYQFGAELQAEVPMSLAARYLCVRVLGDYRHLAGSSDILWRWVRDGMNEPLAPGIVGHVGSVALDLEYVDSPVPPN